MSFMKKVLGVLKEMGEGFTDELERATRENEVRRKKDAKAAEDFGRWVEGDLIARAMAGDRRVANIRSDIWAQHKPVGF